MTTSKRNPILIKYIFCIKINNRVVTCVGNRDIYYHSHREWRKLWIEIKRITMHICNQVINEVIIQTFERYVLTNRNLLICWLFWKLKPKWVRHNIISKYNCDTLPLREYHLVMHSYLGHFNVYNWRRLSLLLLVRHDSADSFHPDTQ